MPLKVLLDSNFLMLYPVFHGDLLEELEKAVDGRTEKIVPTAVYEELIKISQKDDSKQKKQAEIVLQFIKKEKFIILNIELGPSENVDELLARTAQQLGCFVATNDRELKKKLIKLGIPIVYLRQRNHLEAKGKLS